MREFIPLHILYPKHFDSSGRRKDSLGSAGAVGPAGDAAAASAKATPGDLPDYSGVWTRVKCENFEAFAGVREPIQKYTYNNRYYI